MIDWNTDILRQLLEHIVARRICMESISKNNNDEDMVMPSSMKPFDEVKEIISLPQKQMMNNHQDIGTVTLSGDVLNQLREYVSHIASLYRNNEFHNFEHVSESMSARIYAYLCFCIDLMIFIFDKIDRHHM